MVYFKKMFDGRGRDGQRGGKRREEGKDGVDKRADVAGADRGAGAWGTLCPLVKPQAWEFRLEDSLGSTQPGKRLLIKPSCTSEKWRWRSIFSLSRKWRWRMERMNTGRVAYGSMAHEEQPAIIQIFWIYPCK